MNTTLKGLALAALVLLLAAPVAADDGEMFRKNVSKTPDLETDHATFKVMNLYVPAQTAGGTVEPIEYIALDETYTEERVDARPRVAFYHDGAVEHVADAGGFPGHGRKDVFGAVSLDDGATWKRANLSGSADRSSFTLRDGTPYPGDTFRLSADVVGNRALVAWASRYCESGSPLYAWEDEAKDGLLAAYPELDNPVTVIGETEPYQLYLDDLFGIAGSQGSSDFADEEYPTVGEVPYACLWVARGTLEPASLDGDQLKYDSQGTLRTVVWRAAERVTSGVRDVHRIEVHGAPGAGFAVTWQEDPEGLRPGKGLGPGAGWSGAIAHQKTDIWYSHIGWDHFDDVCLNDPDTEPYSPGELVDFALETQPKAAVPFAMPVRITDNNACEANVAVDAQGYQPYCYADFDDNGTADLCASSESWTNPGGTSFDLCIAEDGRHLTGRTASTRARVKRAPYTDGEGNTSAWIALAYESTKGLGAELNEEDEPVDIGKNLWYHTFDLLDPEVVAQGLMVNQPAIDLATGEFFPFEVDEWGNEYYQTEIARRASLISQGVGKAMASEYKTAALVLYKQGILFQGGPADIMARRWVLPGTFDPAVDNPYAYENMECAEIDDEGNRTPFDLLYSDGSNPNYVRGLCPATALNLSGNTIVACDNGSTGEECADAFPWDPPEDEEPAYPKVLEWEQTVANFNDQSWENPYDVAKGHRGFINGDFIMMMYGWSPNWKALTTGHDHNNIYVRRSFDGGATWTTTPTTWNPPGSGNAEWTADGTTSCEIYRDDDRTAVCTDYDPGDFEPARNVSLLDTFRVTVLDPRFTPTPSVKNMVCDDDGDGTWDNCGYTSDTVDLYDDDADDPSMFFVTYQTGDNTTVAETEPTPLDMYYSRAVNWGDEYVVWTDPTAASSGENTECEPFLINQDAETLDGLCNEFDWLENKRNVMSAEAALQTNPGGTFLCAIWDQWKEDAHEVPYESDAIYRRIWFFDDETSDPPDPPDGGPGGQGGNPGGGNKP